VTFRTTARRLTFIARTLYVHAMNDSMGKPVLDTADEQTSNEVAITLGMLSAIEESSTLSQRSLAKELGIALGLANAYLKRCVKKGWIKVQQVPANRYAYYLTPIGFSEKARLTGEYLSTSLEFFRLAREQAAEVCALAEQRHIKRLALIGSGDLAEIMALTALDSSLKIVGIVDAAAAGSRVAGLDVVADLVDLDSVEAVIITDMRSPQKSYDHWSKRLGKQNVFAAGLLKISRAAPVARGDLT